MGSMAHVWRAKLTVGIRTGGKPPNESTTASVMSKQAPFRSTAPHFLAKRGRFDPIGQEYPDDRNGSMESDWRDHMDHLLLFAVPSENGSDSRRLSLTREIFLNLFVNLAVVIDKLPHPFGRHGMTPSKSVHPSTNAPDPLVKELHERHCL